MKIHHDLDHLPTFERSAITIGSFDGVHKGHRIIIERVKQLARSIQGESILVTFHPHPRKIIDPQDDSLRLITTTGEKVEQLERLGLDHVVVVPFTIEFSQLTADEYIQKFLVDKFQPRYIVIGYDHRFGRGRQGDINYLRWYGREVGYEVVEIEPQMVDDLTVSSTKIREAIQRGDIRAANQLLGHYFTLSGTVVHGNNIGTDLGFPTANIELQSTEKLIPPNGIYAVQVIHQEQRYRGMLYIGDRPTLRKYHNRTIEVNIFDFNRRIYGDPLTIELVDFIRHDRQFSGLDHLREQLQRDRITADRLLSEAQEAEKKFRAHPMVAVAILNYNGRPFLEQFLPQLTATTYPNYAIYLADNASTDDSLDFVRTHYPSVTVLELEQNYGFAEGYNQALRRIQADYYLLLNSDVEVTPGWLEPLIELMERDRSVAACQPKILAQREKKRFEYAGASGGWLDYLGYPFCRGRIFMHVEEDNGQYDSTEEIFWASGAAMLLRARLFHDFGGFDSDYFAHLEEIDLCWRLKRAGYKIMVRPRSVVYHVGGGTLNYNTPRKTYLNFRNTLFTILKNEPANKLFWLLPLRILLDLAAVLLFLSQGKLDHIRSVFRAHGTFYGQFRKTLEKRRQNNDLIAKISVSNKPNLAGVYLGSIVWDYFFRRKKQFNQL